MISPGLMSRSYVAPTMSSAQVSDANTGAPQEPPRSARVSRRYEPTQSWLSFLWLGLRDGLLKTVQK